MLEHLDRACHLLSHKQSRFFQFLENVKLLGELLIIVYIFIVFISVRSMHYTYQTFTIQ